MKPQLTVKKLHWLCAFELRWGINVLLFLRSLTSHTYLKSQNAEAIEAATVSRLHAAGFTDDYLKEDSIGVVVDEASVMLGKKSGVGTRLERKLPLLCIWHCMNHRLELAVGDTVSGVANIFNFHPLTSSTPLTINQRWQQSSARIY